MDNFDYENDKDIDPNALDIECLEQANIYMRYAEKLADAKQALTKAKEALDITDTIIIREIRKDPESHGLDPKKVTETAMKAIAKLDERHEKAFHTELELQHEVDVLSGAVKAMDYRKAALGDLVRLMGAQYFAAPAEPRDLGNEVGKKAKQRLADATARAKMKQPTPKKKRR